MWQRIKNLYHLIMAIAANIRYGFPSRNLTAIGVTGTDGKTPTVSLIYHILRTSGKDVSMISSVGASINGKNYPLPFHVTTPSPFALQKFIKMACLPFPSGPLRRTGASRRAAGRANGKNKGKKKYLVLEVTSHSLDQFRVFGISFDIGVITNVTWEHLDYHKTYENYVLAKLKLLRNSTNAVVNKDDQSYPLVKSELKKTASGFRRTVTYGMSKASDVNPENFQMESQIAGQFNRYNILASVTVSKLLGIKDSLIKRAVESFEPPLGRQDLVYNKGFRVMIDFAHTPNSFKQVLSYLRGQIRGRIIHVFGCAGERDKLKRPKMGKISSRLSDIVIVTAEDPRSENIENIMNDITSGIQNSEYRIQNKTLIKIPDRQEAINTAIAMTKKGDLVIITGKAHEKSMNYGRGEEPWDEYKAVKKAIEARLDEKN